MTAYGPIDADQEKYSLLDRNMERNGALEYCRRQGIAVLAYSPLANGLLTGKIRSDRQYGAGDLRRGNRRFAPTNVDRVNSMLDQFRPIAERHQATLAQLVIAWTFSQPGLTCALCGARERAASDRERGCGRHRAVGRRTRDHRPARACMNVLSPNLGWLGTGPFFGEKS